MIALHCPRRSFGCLKVTHAHKAIPCAQLLTLRQDTLLAYEAAVCGREAGIRADEQAGGVAYADLESSAAGSPCRGYIDAYCYTYLRPAERRGAETKGISSVEPLCRTYRPPADQEKRTPTRGSRGTKNSHARGIYPDRQRAAGTRRQRCVRAAVCAGGFISHLPRSERYNWGLIHTVCTIWRLLFTRS